MTNIKGITSAINSKPRVVLYAGDYFQHTGSHSFEVETDRGDVDVYHCTNRGQARKIVERAGYEVRSVNFTG